jgi:hypothetical protein
MGLTQRQRSAQRKRDDYLDSCACAEKAGYCCEICGKPCEYPFGSLHHARRKRTLEDRRNQDWHVWCCAYCHTLAHASDGFAMRSRIDDIIEQRERSRT